MKNVKNVLRRLENQVEEMNEENVVEEAKESMSEREFMEMLMAEVNSKTLTILGDFDEKQVAHVKAFADQLWFYEDDTQRNVYIDIASHGGYACCLFAILDILQNLKDEWGCNFVTRAVGYAESCGFILWCFGDKRYMGDYSEIMCHLIFYGCQGNPNEHEKRLKENKKAQNKVDKIIMEKTGLTKRQLNKWYKEGDKFIDKEEAMKLGILTIEEEEEKENNE